MIADTAQPSLSPLSFDCSLLIARYALVKKNLQYLITIIKLDTSLDKSLNASPMFHGRSTTPPSPKSSNDAKLCLEVL